MLTSEQIIKGSERLTAAGHWYVDLADETLYWSTQVSRIHGLDLNEPEPDVETALDGAYRLAERLRVKIAERPIPGETTTLRVTASFGVTQAEPSRDTVEGFLARTDRGLYQAMANGRDGVCCQTDTGVGARGLNNA